MSRTEYAHMEQATLLEGAAPFAEPSPSGRGRKIAALTGGVALVACVVVAAVRFAVAPAPNATALRELQQTLNVEVYFGPMCPDSLNFMSMSLGPFMESAVPANLVQLTVFPYLTAADMPPSNPCDQPGTPCFLARGPVCVPQLNGLGMPAPFTTLKPYVSFVSCGLGKVAMNHAVAAASYSGAEEAQCASQAGVQPPAVFPCAMALGDLQPGNPTYQKIMGAEQRISAYPGTQPPYVFINNQMLAINPATGAVQGYKTPPSGISPIPGLAGENSLGAVICALVGPGQPGCAGM